MVRIALVVILGCAAAGAGEGRRWPSTLEGEVERYVSTAGSQAYLVCSDPEEPEVEVSAPRLIEETLVGPNKQPQWTTRRRFPTTRAYVLPPFQWEIETWWRGTYPKEGGPKHRFLEEVGIGLPHRFQVDLYWRLEKAPNEDLESEGVQAEVRWALAEWGKIPLNPTLYVEWLSHGDDPDAVEFKVLLAEELRPRVHWAFNFFYEIETGGAREEEIGFSTAASYTILDEKLSAGVELKFASTSSRGSRAQAEAELFLGPSLQWLFLPRWHLDVVPLFGLTPDSPALQVWVVIGVELGKKHKSEGVRAPTSTRAQ